MNLKMNYVKSCSWRCEAWMKTVYDHYLKRVVLTKLAIDKVDAVIMYP